jgi:hypothetical protein
VATKFNVYLSLPAGISMLMHFDWVGWREIRVFLQGTPLEDAIRERRCTVVWKSCDATQPWLLAAPPHSHMIMALLYNDDTLFQMTEHGPCSDSRQPWCRLDVVRYLAPLSCGESPHCAPEKLISAAASNDVGMVEGLLLAGMDPNASDFDQRTPLHLAVSNRSMEARTDNLAPCSFLDTPQQWGHKCTISSNCDDPVQVLRLLLSNPRTQLGPVDAHGTRHCGTRWSWVTTPLQHCFGPKGHLCSPTLPCRCAKLLLKTMSSSSSCSSCTMLMFWLGSECLL